MKDVKSGVSWNILLNIIIMVVIIVTTTIIIIILWSLVFMLISFAHSSSINIRRRRCQSVVSEDRNIAPEWPLWIGRLESGYPDAVGLPTARSDDQDGASSQHCMEICWEREKGW